MFKSIFTWLLGWSGNSKNSFSASLAVLVLRVGAGTAMAALHGWGKLTHFSHTALLFPDPLGVGSKISLALVVGAELFCSILIIVGLMTRLSVLPLAVTMVVAVFVMHGDDPWAEREMPALYLLVYLVILLCGGGRFAVDTLIAKLAHKG